MIVDDHSRFPGLLRANLNILHNYASDITILKSLGKALDELRFRSPDLLFVADGLRPYTSFAQIQRFVRQAGYAGPLIACSAECTPEKRHRLFNDGATYVLDREETHTASIIDLLSLCLAPAQPDAAPEHELQHG
jgi:CheY-like chemotaxis protein